MTINRLLAQMTVTDLDRAESWYTAFFDAGPDARPMPGLLEWHLTDSFGVQVWTEPERAGRSCMVLDGSAVDEVADRLDRAGISHADPVDATTVRTLQLEDPDGNRIVFTSLLGGQS